MRELQDYAYSSLPDLNSPTSPRINAAEFPRHWDDFIRTV